MGHTIIKVCFLIISFFFLVSTDAKSQEVTRVFIEKNPKIANIFYQEMQRCLFSSHTTQYRLVQDKKLADKVVSLEIVQDQATIFWGEQNRLEFSLPKGQSARQRLIRYNTYKLLHGEENFEKVANTTWFQKNLKLRKIVSKGSQSKAQSKAQSKESSQREQNKKSKKKVTTKSEFSKKAAQKAIPQNDRIVKSAPPFSNFNWKDLGVSIYLQQVFQGVIDSTYADLYQPSVEIAIGMQYENYHLFYAKRSMGIIEQQETIYSQTFDQLKLSHAPTLFQKLTAQKLRQYLSLGYMLSFGKLDENLKNQNKQKQSDVQAFAIELVANHLARFQIGVEMTSDQSQPFMAFGIGWNL